MWGKGTRIAVLVVSGWMSVAKVAGATGVDVACVSVAPVVSASIVTPVALPLVYAPSVVVTTPAVVQSSVVFAAAEPTVLVTQAFRSHAPVVVRSRARIGLAPAAVLRTRTIVSRSVSRLSVLGGRVCH